MARDREAVVQCHQVSAFVKAFDEHEDCERSFLDSLGTMCILHEIFQGSQIGCQAVLNLPISILPLPRMPKGPLARAMVQSFTSAAEMRQKRDANFVKHKGEIHWDNTMSLAGARRKCAK